MHSSILYLASALGGVGGQPHTPADLHRERPGTQGTGDWLGPRAGLGGCGKFRSHPDYMPDS
jgi:hypothetical protein